MGEKPLRRRLITTQTQQMNANQPVFYLHYANQPGFYLHYAEMLHYPTCISTDFYSDDLLDLGQCFEDLFEQTMF